MRYSVFWVPALMAVPAWAADVTVSSSADVIAVGNSATLTCTVTPSTYVSRVTFSYEDGAPSQEDTSAPYEVQRTFNVAMDDLTVTATVEFSDGSPTQQATVDVDVVGLALSGSTSPSRGWSVAYTARSDPQGKVIDLFEWSYTAGGVVNTWSDYDLDNNDVSTWAGKMVISGTLSVQAVVCGVTCTKTVSVTIAPRNWSTPQSCNVDNESDWGSEPTASAVMGENRDRESNDKLRYFVPQANDGDFSQAFSVSGVTSGPCQGWWYVSGSTLVCQRETVINKYIKAGGPAPAGASQNFYDRNAEVCLDDLMDEFVQAVGNHEYRGTPATARSEEGHYGRIENGIYDAEIAGDPRKAAEGLLARSSASLWSLINLTVEDVEDDLHAYAGGESWSADGPNWGGPDALGSGLRSTWNPGSQTWSDCVNGVEKF